MGAGFCQAAWRRNRVAHPIVLRLTIPNSSALSPSRCGFPALDYNDHKNLDIKELCIGESGMYGFFLKLVNFT